MAFFDSLLSGDYTGAAINAAAQIGGALITSSANSDAAATANTARTAAAGISSDAATRAAQIQADANQKGLGKYIDFAGQGRDQLNQAKAAGLGAIDAGTQSYANTINPLLTPNPILLPTYRGLTPQQQTGEADMLRTAGATLASSGLRGAGRAGVAAVMDQDRRYQEEARANNDADTRGEMRRAAGVSNNARSGLAGVEAQAGGAKANTEVGIGNQLASSFNNTGSVASNLTSATGSALAGGVTSAGAATAGAVDSAGQTSASSDLATAKLTGSTLGSLGSIIAGNLSPGPIGSSPSSSFGAFGSGSGTNSNADPFAGRGQNGSV